MDPQILPLCGFEDHVHLTPVIFDIAYRAPVEAETQQPNAAVLTLQNAVYPFFAAALTIASDFRTSNLACFRNLITLNRSKSVRARLRSF